MIDGQRQGPDDDKPADWPDLAGRIVKDSATGAERHILPIRVYFEDTDFSGLVYHASYLRWCERGRSDFLRLLGNSHQELIAGTSGQPGAAKGEAAAFVVRRMTLEYLKPARIDDVLEVETQLTDLSAASMQLMQIIRRGGIKLFEARVLVVLVSQSGKPVRLSKALRGAFAPTGKVARAE